MYTSLYKSNNVRLTQKFKGVSVHGGVDLVCDDTLFAKVYLPTFLGDGEVWKITNGYSYNGKWYADGRIIWVKHPNGMGQRFIHSRDSDIQVKVGQKVKVGDWICKQGDSGPVTGVHLHYDILKIYNDTKSRIDPMNYIDKETMNKYKKGDTVKMTSSSKINIRVLPDTGADVLSQASPGAVGSILSNGVNAGGYLWNFVKFEDVSGWVAVKWSEKTSGKITHSDGSKVVDPTVALNKAISEKESRIKELESEYDALSEKSISIQLKYDELDIEYKKLESQYQLALADLKVCKNEKIKDAMDFEISDLIKALIERLIGIITRTTEE